MGIPRGYISTRAARQEAAKQYMQKEQNKRLGIKPKPQKLSLKKFLPKKTYSRIGGKVQKSFQYSREEKQQAMEKRKKSNTINYAELAQ